jgi:hypothetical protein
MAVGNFSAGNGSLDPPPYGENLPIPIPHLTGRFFPKSEPNGERRPDGDPRPRHNQEISLYLIPDPNPMRNPYPISNLNSNVVEPGATGLFYFFINWAYSRSP